MRAACVPRSLRALLGAWLSKQHTYHNAQAQHCAAAPLVSNLALCPAPVQMSESASPLPALSPIPPQPSPSWRFQVRDEATPVVVARVIAPPSFVGEYVCACLHAPSCPWNRLNQVSVSLGQPCRPC